MRKELTEGNDTIEQIVCDEKEFGEQKVCVVCGCQNDLSYRICRNPDCGGTVVQEKLHFSKYSNTDYLTVNPYQAFDEVPGKLPKIKCKTGEPEFINPNGYHNIIQVLQSIGERWGIKQYGNGKREWIFVECDGLPCNLIRSIIVQVLRCDSCKHCFWGSDAFKEHNCFIVKSSKSKKEFDWLIPVFGLLHLEMNLGRAFVKLNWDVFVKCTGFALGFQSPKALSYLYKGADHHKLWHFLEINYDAISLELVYPYVKECIEKKIVPTCDGYWMWSQQAENPNYVYIQHVTLTYLHSLMMLRACFCFSL